MDGMPEVKDLFWSARDGRRSGSAVITFVNQIAAQTAIDILHGSVPLVWNCEEAILANYAKGKVCMQNRFF